MLTNKQLAMLQLSLDQKDLLKFTKEKVLDTKANTSDVKLVKLVKSKIDVGDFREPYIYLIPNLIRDLVKIIFLPKVFYGNI